MIDEAAANLHLWENWAEMHMTGTEYDIAGFLADPSARPLDHVIRETVGDVSGKRLLHLQCHIGLDTVRLAMMGAVDIMGVDFSPKALEGARAIADSSGVSATFVEADVCALPPSVPRESFDVVFTSYGTIMWLPDLEPWADSIVSRLAPGGVFHIVDVHPLLCVFDDLAPKPPLAVRYSYFTREPLHFVEHGSYADRDADFEADSYAWQHTFEEIIGVLVRRGLVVERLREYPMVAWQALEYLVRDEEGLWRLPQGAGDIPLMFALTVRKPVQDPRA